MTRLGSLTWLGPKLIELGLNYKIWPGAFFGLGSDRDVKKTHPHGYPWVIPATGRVLGEDFAPAGNGDENFKYPRVPTMKLLFYP